MKYGDIMAGGGFRGANGTCSSSSPSYVSPASTGNEFAGGIRAFGSRSEDKGSYTSLAAMALGRIIGNISGPIGFYSKSPTTSGYTTFFANDIGGGQQPQPSGGYLNSTDQSHCVPDFFDNTRLGPLTDITDAKMPNSTGGYLLGGIGGNSFDGGSLGRGDRITIYVDGDVTINTNIEYVGNWNAKDRDDYPYFTLIAKGNIYVADSVDRLDGLYIAQPRDGQADDTGIFATCDSGLCANSLTINGAVIAQHIQLLRAHGTMAWDKSTDFNQDPAEVINFVPSIVLGRPYLSGENGRLESIFSLPPVF